MNGFRYSLRLRPSLMVESRWVYPERRPRDSPHRWLWWVMLHDRSNWTGFGKCLEPNFFSAENSLLLYLYSRRIIILFMKNCTFIRENFYFSVHYIITACFLQDFFTFSLTPYLYPFMCHSAPLYPFMPPPLTCLSIHISCVSTRANLLRAKDIPGYFSSG